LPNEPKYLKSPTQLQKSQFADPKHTNENFQPNQPLRIQVAHMQTDHMGHRRGAVFHYDSGSAERMGCPEYEYCAPNPGVVRGSAEEVNACPAAELCGASLPVSPRRIGLKLSWAQRIDLPTS
jgi:hypothetical protein